MCGLADGVLNLTVQKVTSGNCFPLRETVAAFSFRGTRGRRGTIAIYHLSIKIISRGKGKSAVAAAAYRAGERIINKYDGLTHDYTRKGGIAHTEILLPDHAPREHFDRSTLWNAVEKVEKSRNSQLAREIELALPKELNSEQQIELARDYCRKFFVSVGMCADICIHDKGDGNPHAHIMLTMRPIKEDGTWGDKQKKEYILDPQGNKIYDSKKRQYKCKSVPTTDWNEQTKAEEWRQGWADVVNSYLVKNNVVERVDHRSYERQGIEQIPTIHMGVAAFQMEKRGIATRRGDINRQVALDNKMLRQLRTRINKLKEELDELLSAEKTTISPSNHIPSTSLVDALTNILKNPDEKTRHHKISDLKTVAKATAFLEQQGIADLAGLYDKVTEIYDRQNATSDSLKRVERRMKTLAEHIRHADNYFQHRALYREYTQQKPGRQAAFYERNRAELVLYESAERYLKQVMNGHTTIPTKAWKVEAASLVSQKEKLYEEYLQLKAEVRDADVIRRCVERTMQDNKPILRREKDMGLE